MSKKSDELKNLLNTDELEELQQEVRLSSVEVVVNPQIIIEAMLRKLAEKKNPLILFQDKAAQEAIGHLSVSEQEMTWIRIKEVCPGLNTVQGRRAVREAVSAAKQDRLEALSSQGLIEFNGAYFAERQTQNGSVEIQISNFVLKPIMKLVMPDHREFLKVTVSIGGSEKPFERILSPNDLLGRKELLKALGSTAAQWVGNDITVQQLVGHLANVEVPVKRGVPHIGLYEDRFITPGLVITAEGSEQDSDFVYVPQRSVFEGYIKFTESSQTWEDLVRVFLEGLPCLQSPSVIWPVVGWFFSCIVAIKIRKRHNEFPILHAWGTGGSGKTSLFEILLKALGVQAEPFAATTKEFVLLKTLSGTNALPVFLDEYRPATMDPKRLKSLHEILLLSYKASIASRGRPDQSVNEYPLHAPVCMAGEAPLPETETGLQERVIQVKFDRNYIDQHPEAQEKFNQLLGLPLADFAAGYVQWTLNQNINEYHNKALDQVDKLFNGLRVAVRVRHNLAAILVGIILFKKLASEVGVQVPEINLTPIFKKLVGQDPKRQQEPKNAVDRFMMHLEQLAHIGELRSGIDYVLDENENLVIYTNAVISAAQKYCRARGLEHELVNDRALRAMMEEKVSPYILKPYGHRARIGNQNIRATVVDAKQLEECLGISLDTWRRRDSSNEGAWWNSALKTPETEKPDEIRVEEEPF